MKRTIALLGAVAALAVVGIGATTSAQEPSQDQTPDTCDGHVASFHKAQAKGIAKAIYATRKWQDSTPAKKGQHAYFRWHVQCLYQPRADKALRAFKKAHKATFYKYRGLRNVAGYNCGGKWSWWSIPCYIISCESGFSWSAYNPSGAVGPYQLLGWGAPFPVSSWRQKMEHHRIAASLSLSNWVCY